MSSERAQAPVIVTCDGMPVMTVSLANCRGVAVITISGELDLCTAPRLTDLVEHVAAAHPDRVIIDMANVTFFCAAGITVLMKAHDMITGAGGNLVLRAASRQARRILIISGADRLFQPDTTASWPDVDDGLDRTHLSPGQFGRQVL